MFRWSSCALPTLALFVTAACSGSTPPDSATPTTAPPAAAATAAPASDPMMQLHHLHGLMAHGFEMALEGSNLSMLAAMKMSATADGAAASHGTTMITEGRALIEEAINGPAMHALHGGPAGSNEAMNYTHNLGKAMVNVLDHLQQMPPGDPANKQDMAVHHLHIALAHAAVMASQAASLKMTAAMKMAGPADEEAASHATAMFAHARALIALAISGEAMKEAHGTASPDAMQMTHDLGDAITSAVDMLATMP